MPITSTIKATRGSALTIIVTVEGSGDLSSLNGHLLFTIAAKAGAAAAAFQKAGTVIDGPGRQVGATMTAAETAGLKAKAWKFDYWSTVVGAEAQLANGPFELDESVRPVPTP